MSESAKDLYFRRGEVILGPDSDLLFEGNYKVTMNGTRINSVVEAGKSYIIAFNSDDPEWANMTLLKMPGLISTPLQQLNSTTYIVKFTATGAETGIGIDNSGSGKNLPFTNYTLYEYSTVISGNVLRPFKADKMYYRNQEVQKLYLGTQLVWEKKEDFKRWSSNLRDKISNTLIISIEDTPPNEVNRDTIQYIEIVGYGTIGGNQIHVIFNHLFLMKSSMEILLPNAVGAPVGTRVIVHYT